MANSEVTDTLPATETRMSQYTPLESQPIEPLSYGRLIGKHAHIGTLGSKAPIIYVPRAPSIVYGTRFPAVNSIAFLNFVPPSSTSLINKAPPDLSRSEFTVGRDDRRCQLILQETHFARRSFLTRVSKVHFTIEKNINDFTSPTFIIDTSLNGTFVNDKLVGKNVRRILKHGDIIALGSANVKAFVYHDLCQVAASEVKASKLREKYHIGRRLGSGACGTVYLLHELVSCQPFAMKHVVKNQLNPSELTRPNVFNDPRRVMGEAIIMMNLNHPCVIKIHDIIDEPDAVYMVLEYMKGGDLLSRIVAGTYLPEKTAKLFFLQMCHAVKYLHEQGITHRDLKPDNILLQDSQEYTLLKVTDFGLSRFIGKNSVMRTLCGTPLYMAPEVLETSGCGSYTSKVDIWSLGVVLFTMLSGTLPFDDTYGSPATEQIKRGMFSMCHPVWLTVSSMAKQIILDILNVNPTVRPSIDALLASSWFRDDEIIREVERLMKIPLLLAGVSALPNTSSEVENNNAGPSRSMEPARKRRRY